MTIYLVKDGEVKQCWMNNSRAFTKGENVHFDGVLHEVRQIIHTMTAIFVYIVELDEFELPNTDTCNQLMK